MEEFFQKGVTFIEFVNQDKDTYQEKTLELYNQIIVDEDLQKAIQAVDRPIYVLVFAEIWCPDCMINVPALQKIAEYNNHFTIRIVSREGNEAYMENYRINGKPKIPTFIFMEEDFTEIGAFIEQPQVIKTIEGKGNQVEIIVAKRKYRKGEYISETIKEILEIVKR
ncbi:hypothetical protein Gferi_16965 [Geosporobacter ferrireducens]|uniref:Thioredoxin n=1 Tax=Geosporobacter ferrireducens TaxID=1424294 RepID=A0A1D8GQN3_9FIRM|nr:hypothetical protein Gferi_16965 [Geosporobacter ferrireducens]